LGLYLLLEKIFIKGFIKKFPREYKKFGSPRVMKFNKFFKDDKIAKIMFRVLKYPKDKELDFVSAIAKSAVALLVFSFVLFIFSFVLLII